MTQDSALIAQLAKELSELRSRLTNVERGPRLSHASIEGGALIIHDENGEPVLTIGHQEDGVYAVVGINGGVVVASDLDLPAGSITETDISDDAISTPKLTANAVTADKIEAGAVTANKITANAIDGRVITGVSIVGGEFVTAGSDGSYVHIHTDPTEGSIIDMRPSSGDGAAIQPASIRTATDPQTGEVSTLIQGPNIDGNGSARLFLSSDEHGGTLNIESGYWWLHSEKGSSWSVNGDWEIATRVWDPDTGTYLYEIHTQVQPDGSLYCGSITTKTGATFQGPVKVWGPVKAGDDVEIEGELNVDGPVRIGDEDVPRDVVLVAEHGGTHLGGLLTIGPAPSASSKAIQLNEGYALYVDNAGGGGSNNRVWLDGPNNGEVVIGPRAGGSFLGSIRLRTNATTASAANCFIDSTTQQLRRTTSSLRYKRDVEDLAVDLNMVRQLRPVRFRDRGEVDEVGDAARHHVGFIAEEVHAIGLTDIVAYAADEPDSVQYDRLVPMLLLLIRELEGRVADLESRLGD